MRIALTLTPPTERYFRWAAQIGVTDFVCRYPAHYGLEPIAGLEQMHQRAGAFGLRLSVVEGYLPLQAIVRGEPQRDEQIAAIARFIERMGELQVEVLCYNFMPFLDWTRTSFTTPTRGGALTSSYSASLDTAPVARPGELPGLPGLPGAEQLWDNLAYFLERIVPVAEAAGVKLAMHPDDPPLPAFRGAPQIMNSVEAFERLTQLHASPAHGICFCQGTFAEMDVDIPQAIARLSPRIHYVHFRDVRGHASDFVETFQDDGKTDMVAAMRAYHAAGFRGPMRPDHVPTLFDERDGEPGYTMLGRLFAVGYMRGLIQAIGNAETRSGAESAEVEQSQRRGGG